MSDESVEKVRKNIIKQFGDNICLSGNEVVGRKQDMLKISPSLNLGMRGGIPSGTITIISGKMKMGKTTTVLSFAAKCQAAGMHVYYADIEFRLKKMNLEGIAGLHIDQDHFTVIQSSKEKILTAEDHLTIAEMICHDHPNALYIMDSASALCSEKESLADMKAAARNDGPKLLAQFTRKVSNVIPVNNVTVCIIQHLIANTSGYGVPFMEDGGNKIQYAMDTKLRIKSSKPWEEKDVTVGLIVTWQIVTSAFGAAPNTEVESFIRFGKGIDDLKEYVELGTNLGLIKKAGAWYEFEGEKYQGGENLYRYFDSNEVDRTKLIEKVSELCGMNL